MSLYAINAYEKTYQGYHGINQRLIVEAPSLEVAEELADEASYDVMQSYSSIMNEIEEEASEMFYNDTPEWELYVRELMDANIAFEVWEIIDTCGKSVAELEAEFINDVDGFITTHCSQ